ncbi:hypothetical protein [Corallococcus silvisoli]|uniref:hypothetical protein n=1 Tax=Corallococcus silvisoli TaxID=2697031 RepID=UPI001377E205|nr:hypothetical protein [Corallococcus silvisoli]NBD14532.1 hypothetical protein [Corallococcus silvisoli]
MVSWSIVTALLISVSSADEGPTLPLTLSDVFAGECSTYGKKWVARKPVSLRTEPSSDAPVIRQMGARESFVALTGNVVTLKAGVVRVTAPTKFRPIIGFEKYGPVETAQKGDRLYLLRFNGENAFDIWFKGRVIRDVEPFWNVNTPSISIKAEGKPTAVAESYPENRWYVRVKDAKGQMGWIDMTGAEIDGVDGCG